MSFMKTSQGNKFFPSEPHKTTFDIKDIAHALSNLCRFGGHTKRFYSVAQHSLLVADIVKSWGGSPDAELWALMHDSTEAYMIDLPTPIKATMPIYAEREHELMALITNSFDLPNHGEHTQLPSIVKLADAVALVTEARQLMRDGLKDWSERQQRIASHPIRIVSLIPAEAKRAFLARYKLIQRRRSKRVAKLSAVA